MLLFYCLPLFQIQQCLWTVHYSTEGKCHPKCKASSVTNSVLIHYQELAVCSGSNIKILEKERGKKNRKKFKPRGVALGRSMALLFIAMTDMPGKSWSVSCLLVSTHEVNPQSCFSTNVSRPEANFWDVTGALSRLKEHDLLGSNSPASSDLGLPQAGCRLTTPPFCLSCWPVLLPKGY